MSNDSLYRILHIADPHFSYCHFKDGPPAEIGRRHADELEEVLDQNGLYPPRFDCIVLSGDFTFCGQDEGFEAAGAFVAKVSELTRPQSVVVIPGNHDIVLLNPVWIRNLYLPASSDEADERFRQFLASIQQYTSPTSEWLTGSYRVRRSGLPGLFVEGLNSCRVERRDAQGWGYIGVDQLYQLGQKLIEGPQQGRPQRGDVVIVVIHHNPLPIWDLGLDVTRNPPEKRKFSFVMDAAGLLNFLSDLGVTVLLHGHTHTQSTKVVDGYSSADVPRFSPMWVLGAGSFALKRRAKDPPHHFQIVEIEKDPYDLKLTYQDVKSDSVGEEGQRIWRVMDRRGTVLLTSTWDPDSAKEALKLRPYEKYSVALRMEIIDTWSVLRAKRLDPGNWQNVFSGICDRTMEGATELGVRNPTTLEIRKILQGIFEDPPSDHEICNFRLEQIILKRWMKR